MSTKRTTPLSDKTLTFLEKLSGRKMTFGNLLWSIRESEELSQVIFSKKLKISRQYLCDIEHGRRIVSAEAAASFAKTLGYSPMHFVRLALQDSLNKLGLHFDIDLHEHKDAA